MKGKQKTGQGSATEFLRLDQLDAATVDAIRDSIDNPSPSPVSTANRSSQEDIDECLRLFTGSTGAGTPRTSDTIDLRTCGHWTDLSLPPLDPQRFAVREVLGVGGFGVVLSVTDRRAQESRALKLLRPSLQSSASLFRRFLREIEIAIRLQHPGTVGVLETGTLGGIPCFLSELVTGPSLGQLLGKPIQVLSPHVAADIMAQVAEALQYAHDHGVLHRDLKPQNILLECEPCEHEAEGQLIKYRPRLTDFGLAKQLTLGESNDSSISAQVELLGTPRYMAPEQAEGRLGDVDVRSDIFSLGAILYLCLTGRTPFDGRSTVEVFAQMRAGRIEKPAAINKSISSDLETVILKCLAFDSRERYRSAAELAMDLRRYLNGEPVAARRATVSRRVRHWAKRNPLTAALAVGLAFSAALSVVLSWSLYLNSKSEAQANERMLRIAFQAVNDAYVDVAEKMLNRVPNSLDEQYRLHQTALAAHQKIADEFKYNPLSRYRLSVQYSYLARAAARLHRFDEARALYVQCLTMLEELRQSDPHNLDYRYDLFFNRKCLADMIGSTSSEKISALREVVHEIDALVNLAPDNIAFRDAQAASLFALGEQLNQAQDPKAATLLRASIRISEQLWNEHPDRPLLAKYAILGRAELASHHRLRGEVEESLRTCQDALECYLKLPRLEDQPFISESLVRNLYFNRVLSLIALERWSESEAAVDAAFQVEATTELHLPHPTAYEARRCELLLALLTAKAHLSATRADCEEITRRIEQSLKRWESGDTSGEYADERQSIRQRLNAIYP